MKKKEIKKLVQQKIAEGKSRQQTFDEIKEQEKVSSEELAKIVKNFIPLALRDEFKKPHTLLLIILGITILFKILAGLPLIINNGLAYLPLLLLMPIINIALTYGVYKYQANMYMFVAIFTIIGTARSALNLDFENLDSLLIIDLIVAASLIGLGFYLRSKIDTGYETVKVKYTNKEGQPRLRNKIKFNS